MLTELINKSSRAKQKDTRIPIILAASYIGLRRRPVWLFHKFGNAMTFSISLPPTDIPISRVRMIGFNAKSNKQLLHRQTRGNPGRRPKRREIRNDMI